MTGIEWEGPRGQKNVFIITNRYGAGTHWANVLPQHIGLQKRPDVLTLAYADRALRGHLPENTIIFTVMVLDHATFKEVQRMDEIGYRLDSLGFVLYGEGTLEGICNPLEF